jgi:NAD(P)-dependent dehydrogenase (short-subunit alcohol dehydrogenase family)
MKTTLITGVGKGIGKALADKFLAEGWFVLGAHHQTGPKQHENMLSFPLELSSPQSINTGRKIDVLINNAGVLLDMEETKILMPKLRGTLEINLFGTIDLTERLIPLVVSGGHIVTVTSSAGSLAEAVSLSVSLSCIQNL